jgi:hypothetical protein
MEIKQPSKNPRLVLALKNVTTIADTSLFVVTQSFWNIMHSTFPGAIRMQRTQLPPCLPVWLSSEVETNVHKGSRSGSASAVVFDTLQLIQCRLAAVARAVR